MNFLGLDLSKIPQQNLADWTVYIIPILYILSTFVSMRLTTSMQNTNKDKKELFKEIISTSLKGTSSFEKNMVISIHCFPI